ncbi:MAG: hypothetical protein EXR98_02200 [Gemmataceae bacterium]|nr:hypothetical protein [Gemmataceae bacterium]
MTKKRNPAIASNLNAVILSNRAEFETSEKVHAGEKTSLGGHRAQLRDEQRLLFVLGALVPSAEPFRRLGTTLRPRVPAKPVLPADGKLFAAAGERRAGAAEFELATLPVRVGV